MINLSNRFASELVEFAEENGLEAIYRQALRYVAPMGGGMGGGARRPGGKGGKGGGDAAGMGGGASNSSAGGTAGSMAGGGDAAAGTGAGSMACGSGGVSGGAAGGGAAAGAPAMGPLDAFLANVPEGQRIAVLDRFLDLARGRLNLVDVEVISAVPLTPMQQHALEVKLIRAFRKRASITLSVDPSLIGGLRVIANDMVFDGSIKRKLSDMKSSIYRAAYFR
ncbi:MAG: F0F1 ATP synthase subunit delta [Clostridiales bacterium]|jgi:F0F1-type ATP synthase delta subunit|nr:F0F1 ATP synthase subunit delta [Clostridiales bacterium]